MNERLQKLHFSMMQLLAAFLATYRRGPARGEIDRKQLATGRIALMKLDGIGDFVLATGLLRMIQKEFAGAEVTFFCRVPVGSLAQQQFPEWTVVEMFDPRCKAQEILLDRAMRKRLKAQKPFDLLLDLRTFRSFVEPTIASWIPARQKIALANPKYADGRGSSRPKEQNIYDLLLPLPATAEPALPRDLNNHLAMARGLFPWITGIDRMMPRLTLEPTTREKVAATLWGRCGLDPEKPFLLVCPGTSTPMKEYPIAKLADAILTATVAHPLPVLIAGGKADERTTAPLQRALQGRCKVVNVSGVFSLPEHLALISLARAVLSMDSCHIHFAGALGRPAVAILGGGHVGMFGPWGESKTFRWLTHPLPCFGCNWRCIYDRPLCIQDIPAGVVAQNLTEVLQAAGEGDRR